MTALSVCRVAALVCLCAAAGVGSAPAVAEDTLETLREQIQWHRYEEAFAAADRMRDAVAAGEGRQSTAWAETVTRLIDVMYIEPLGFWATRATPEWTDHARRAVDILERDKPDSRELVAAGNHLGMFLLASRKLDEAESVLVATRELAGWISDPAGEANSLRWLAQCAKRSREYAAADGLHTEAIHTIREAFGEDDPRIGRLLLDQAESKRWQQDFDAARELDQRAVRVFEAGLPAGHPRFAQAHASLASSYSFGGHYDRALEFRQRALTVANEHFGEDHPYTLHFAQALMASLVLTDRLNEAEPVLEHVIRGCEGQPGLETLLAQTLEEGAVLWARLGNFERSIWAGTTAVGLLEGSDNPFDRALLAATLKHVALSYRTLHDDETAATMLERALELQRSVHGESSFAVVSIARMLCQLRIEQGEIEKARQICEPVQHALVELGSPEFPPEMHDFWLSVARFLLVDGEREAALSLGRRTVDFLRDRLGPQSSATIFASFQLADLLAQAGEIDEAWERLSATIAVARETYGTGNPLYVRLADARATIAWRRGDVGGALADATEVAGTLADRARSVIHALPEAHAEAWLGSQHRPERILFAALLREGAHQARARRAAWDWTLERRGLLLDELAERRRAAHLATSPEARAAWERLTRARRQLAALWVAGTAGVAASELEQALAERTAAESELARVSAPFRERLKERRIGLEQIAASLPARFVLVEICRVRAVDELRDVALILTAVGKTAHVDLGSSDELDRLSRDWQAALDATVAAREPEQLDEVLRSGRALRRAFWDPLRAAVGSAATVLLVADGVAHRFHPGALPADDDRYVMEDGPVVQLISSARDLVRFEKPDVAAGVAGVLAFGAPDFSAAAPHPTDDRSAFRGRSDCIPTGTRDWPALPGTERELRRVSELLGKREQVQLRIGPEASEARLRRDLPGKRLLHLATHGFYVSAEECEAPDSTPLLRSGLVLAGANRDGSPDPGGDDGILTAEELVTLDLRGVELAVLSACEGGRGEVREGEGVQGLRRALEIGGVRSTVTGLWPASDRWTERWMGHFYERRLGGAALPVAAREASLHCLERLRRSGQATHPYLWAGFVTAGDWR